MTVADAIALAGGVTPLGNADKIELRRGDGTKLFAKLESRTRIVDSPIHSGDQIYVRERNWLSRNPGVISAGVSAVLSLTIALFLR